MEKRILFDTSVYGMLAKDDVVFTLLMEKKKNVEVVFYGCTLIRNELKDTPKQIRELNRSLRLHLLYLYDSLITKENHNLNVNDLVKLLAGKYMKEYKICGGSVGYDYMMNDFFIVALATIYQMDIVVSNDTRTMLSYSATEAYKRINKEQGMRNPMYLDYSLFKRKIINESDI